MPRNERSRNPRESALWRSKNESHVTKESLQDLKNVKSGAINAAIALWDPQTNGVRYLKALLYQLCQSLTPENIGRITNIKNRHVGNPITIKHDGMEICMDYLQAILELEFIERNLELDRANILEIGAGYGRTCHSIMSNHDVEKYHIVDIENCLSLSQLYLGQVLDRESYAKITFTSAEDLELLGDSHFDLCINIDSFAEMDADVVQNYLDFVSNHCHNLYVKNPVGKYLDKSLDNHHQDADTVHLALTTGLLRDVIDIHDNRAVEAQAGKFVQAYQPGSEWKCSANSWAAPWSYYWQAMYENLDRT